MSMFIVVYFVADKLLQQCIKIIELQNWAMQLNAFTSNPLQLMAYGYSQTYTNIYIYI